MSQFSSENEHIVFAMDLLELTKALPFTEIILWGEKDDIRLMATFLSQ